MELILVRHAEPVSEFKECDGVADPPLSERGLAQALTAAEWLARESIDHVVASPALRAQETAFALARLLSLEVETDKRLRDANSDPSRYVPIEVERALDKDAYRARVEAYRNADAMQSVSDRVCAALDEWTSRSAGERLVVFCHGSVINVYCSRLLGLSVSAFIEVEYASASRFLVSSGGVRSVKSLNETAYLPR